VGFWSKLFGGGATPEQRVARARQHLADDEHEQVVRVLAGVDGREAEELRAAARARLDRRGAKRKAGPPPLVVHPRAADGSHTVELGGRELTFNAPAADDDGRPRSTDGLDVARRLVAALAERPLEQPAFAFVDAALLLARAGEPWPAFADPERRALAALIGAAAERDPERALAAVRAAAPGPLVGLYAVALAAPFALAELGALARDGHLAPTAALVRRLAAVDPDTCAAVIARAGAPELARSLTAEAVLAALDAGAEPPAALVAGWMRWEDLPAGADRHPWLAREVRRLARTDLDAALALEPSLAANWHHDEDATLAVAGRLAIAEPARAVARARELDPQVDHLPWLTAVARARAAGAAELIDTWIDALDADTYNPYAYFGGVIEACLALGDAARVRRLLARGGASGWQVAHAARWSLAAAAARADAAVPDLLAALLERHDASVVAGRAVEPGGFALAAGRMVIRPAWLALAAPAPHPVETLSVVAALGAHGPAWTDPALP